jgi:hypothetical protein
MDWRAGHTMSLSVYFCDVALHALLMLSCKEWFHFCCAFDKDFKTSFFLKKRGFHNIFNEAGNDMLDLFVKGVTYLLPLVIFHMEMYVFH